jgi:hypothetical protein
MTTESKAELFPVSKLCQGGVSACLLPPAVGKLLTEVTRSPEQTRTVFVAFDVLGNEISFYLVRDAYMQHRA